MSKDEISVLDWWADMDEGLCTGYKGLIFQTKMTREQLVPIIAGLKSKGYLKYARGLMNEDGEMGGSGWGITESGSKAYWDYKEELKLRK